MRYLLILEQALKWCLFHEWACADRYPSIHFTPFLFGDPCSWGNAILTPSPLADFIEISTKVGTDRNQPSWCEAQAWVGTDTLSSSGSCSTGCRVQRASAMLTISRAPDPRRRSTLGVRLFSETPTLSHGDMTRLEANSAWIKSLLRFSVHKLLFRDSSVGFSLTCNQLRQECDCHKSSCLTRQETSQGSGVDSPGCSGSFVIPQ